MTDANSASSTRNSRLIKAPREAIYRAFTDPDALEVWQAPGAMTGKIHEFDARVGGGYRMSLYYPTSEQEDRGKTSAHGEVRGPHAANTNRQGDILRFGGPCLLW